MSNLEVEFKYNADKVDFERFHVFCSKKKPRQVILASGYDHFYSNGNPDMFCRHRIDHNNKTEEITYKKKTSKDDSFVRTEINVSINPGKEADVRALFEHMGYKYNNSIFKSSYIYLFNDHIASYYIVYDLEMKELGRYIEIEVAETPAFQTLEYLKSIEKRYKNMGLISTKRIKESLFELYRKA